MQSNEINQLCPKCTDNIPHLIFKPESNLVNISCPCGNDSSLPLSDYIYEYSSNINKKCIQLIRFKKYSVIKKEKNRNNKLVIECF